MSNLSPPPRYSVVIPVYNSEQIVAQTVARVIEFFASGGWTYEIILVNDGSSDNSWSIIRRIAQDTHHITAINLLRNYGQHTALFCAFQQSQGDYVITLDDDLQNPPEEIIHLIGKANEGYDLVFGQFRHKAHESYRRVGSRLIGYINKKIFAKPDDLVLTNFRIIHRDVIERICSYQTNAPYIPGLALMFASKPANVWVEHQERKVGQSNYNLLKIIELVMRILFNYSSYPLRMVSLAGMVVAALSFVLGIYYLIRALFIGIAVPGWATLVVLVAFFNGLSLLILSMLGEYLIRLLNQVSTTKSYYIKEYVRQRE